MKVVFVEPETPGNIGALARAMNNFDVEELILINPQCEVETGETRKLAKHAYETVKNARMLDSLEEVKEEVEYLVGSTGITPDNYKWERSCLTPKQLKENTEDIKGEIALALGREGKGLNNEELRKCNAVVHIPTSKEYPVMNITHAAAIILYELRNTKEGTKQTKEEETMIKYFNEIVEDLDGLKKPEEVKKIFRRITGKAFLDKKEPRSMTAVLRRIKEELEKKKD